MQQSVSCVLTWTSWSQSWWVGMRCAGTSSAHAFRMWNLFLDNMSCFCRNSGLAGTWWYNLAQSYSGCSFTFQSISQELVGDECSGCGWGQAQGFWCRFQLEKTHLSCTFLKILYFWGRVHLKKDFPHARFKKKVLKWLMGRWLLISVFKTSRRGRLC